MVRLVLVCAVSLIACKRYESAKKLDEACKDDRDCEEGLDCVEGLRATKVCLKYCGATAMESAAGIGGSADTTCPPGWYCGALSVHKLVDGAGNDAGSAYLGLRDRPVCVPDGWTPPGN